MVKIGMDAFFAPLPTNLGAASQKVTALTPADEGIITKVTNLRVLGADSAPDITSLTPDVTRTEARESPFEP